RRDRGRERGAPPARHRADGVPCGRGDLARCPGSDRATRIRFPPVRAAGALAVRRRDDRRSPEGAVKDIFRVRRMWRPRADLKDRYDVVIIGGGSHGLATAYYLAKNHGVRDIAVLEQSYIGSGASGRNTTIIRSNYRTPEGAAFYSTSVQLYEQLSAELDFNLMFSQH